MRTKIEDYIKEHKKEFDTELPSKALWTKIDRSLNKKKVIEPNSVKVWIGVAAALVAVAMTIFFYNPKSDQDQVLQVADVNPAYAKKQVRFASLIERKTDSLELLAKQNPQLYQKFSADLQEIQVDYKQLKHQLPRSANQALLVKAMEKNLELQLQVVSQQLTIINQVNQYRKDNQL
jgi:hypothetical protein